MSEKPHHAETAAPSAGGGKEGLVKTIFVETVDKGADLLHDGTSKLVQEALEKGAEAASGGTGGETHH